MAETINFKEFNKQVKREEMKQKVKDILWAVYDRRYVIASGAVAALALASKANKLADAYNKDRKVYDPSEGHYWKTKRKLSNSDYLEMESIRRRYKCTKGEALSMMGLLKK